MHVKLRLGARMRWPELCLPRVVFAICCRGRLWDRAAFPLASGKTGLSYENDPCPLLGFCRPPIAADGRIMPGRMSAGARGPWAGGDLLPPFGPLATVCLFFTLFVMPALPLG